LPRAGVERRLASLTALALASAGVGFQYFLNHCYGLVQRVGAAAVFVPVALVAHYARRSNRP
jgi:hypothetical protein